MKIELGKSYRGRDGTRIDVFAVKEHKSTWPFVGTYRGTQVDYTPEGRAGYPPTEERPRDIVAEWEEPAPAKPANWEWFGHALHFSGGSRCRFHLGTKVGPWIVSTVGDHAPFPDGVRRPLNTPIGDEKPLYYETMVFPTTGALSCGCPDHHGSEVDGRRYATAQEATAGHMELCRKWESVPKAEATEEKQ